MGFSSPCRQPHAVKSPTTGTVPWDSVSHTNIHPPPRSPTHLSRSPRNHIGDQGQRGWEEPRCRLEAEPSETQVVSKLRSLP